MPPTQDDTQPSTAVAVAVVKAPGPQEKATVSISQVPDWAIKLTEKVVSGLAAVSERLEGLESTDRTLANKVQDMSVDIRQLRDADVRHEEEFRRLSMRTKDTASSASQADLEGSAQLAQERMAREALATAHAATAEKVEQLAETAATKDDLKQVTESQTAALMAAFAKLSKDPIIRTLVTIIGTAITTYAASKGLSIK